MEADILAKVASTDELVGGQIKVQYIPSIDVPEVHHIDGVANWTTPIMSYLKDGLLPEDREEARKLRVRVAKFVLMDEVLYKRGFSQPYQRCLTSNESYYILRDVHERACGNHLGAKFSAIMAEVWNESHIVWEPFQTSVFSTIKSLTWYIFKTHRNLMRKT